MPKRSETIQNHKKLQQQEVNLVKWLWKKNMIRGKQANSVRQYLTRLPFSICSILGTYTCVLGRLVRASKKKVYSKYIRIYDIYIYITFRASRDVSQFIQFHQIKEDLPKFPDPLSPPQRHQRNPTWPTLRPRRVSLWIIYCLGSWGYWRDLWPVKS